MFAKSKKISCILLFACFLIATLTACNFGIRDDKLAEGFDAEEVKAKAQKLIGYINDDNLEDFCAVPMSDEMKKATTVDSMKLVFDQYIGKRGEFVKYKSCVAVGAKDPEGNDYAAAVVVAKYENQTVTYTISYDLDMNLVGFYLK